MPYSYENCKKKNKFEEVWGELEARNFFQNLQNIWDKL